MPTYAYYCEKCGEFEKFQHMSDEPLRSCPSCKAPVKRLPSCGLGVITKGKHSPGASSNIPSGSSCPGGTCPF
ncbi:MAG: zinc ribbon domain-containing protein [Planctomycetota bacterium]|nr:zinc ribbon domain-containing protein [Planctomycetota bacterium]